MTIELGVYKAISAVQGELAASGGISKDHKNAQQNYSFRGIDDIYDTLAPLLAKHHLCILPRTVDRQLAERVSQKGGALFYVTVAMEFDFVSADDGSKHTVKTYGEAMDSADKATNKAMSAAYKYACLQTFCIPTEGENDADATTHEPVAQAQPQKQTQTPPARPQGNQADPLAELLASFPKWANQPLGFGKKFPNETWKTLADGYAANPVSGHGSYLTFIANPKDGSVGPNTLKARACIKWANAEPLDIPEDTQGGSDDVPPPNDDDIPF